MSKPIIQVENLCKDYVISHQGGTAPYETLRESVSAWFRKRKSKVQNPKSEIFHALKDVSFEVKQGEVLGVIGRNGAGKSTLLKILSRITEPTSGRVSLRGRVSSLLEVGTGFHPELTGRENIFLNGAILGMTRAEIRRKFDEIVDFSGVEKFLDTPVKRYSSGMYVRLAFAVAAHLEPEILIIDEVLAVGDVSFQKKCLGKMKNVATGGRTVLFVSHHMPSIKALCTKAIYLSTGTIAGKGPTNKLVAEYLSDSHRVHNTRPLISICGLITVQRVRLEGHDHSIAYLHEPSILTIFIEYSVASQMNGMRIGYILRNEEGTIVNGIANIEKDSHHTTEAGSYIAKLTVDAECLLSGCYNICIGFDAPPYMDSSLFLADVLTVHITRESFMIETGIVSLRSTWNISKTS